MLSQVPPADWQLPNGVSPELWKYLHDFDQARTYDERLADTPLLQVDRAFVEHHCQPPGRLIDLGCGTGRLSLRMAEHSYPVLGVDLSEEMLRVARAKAAALSLQIHFLKANLVELNVLADASFDHAACLFSTLGMIVGSAERRRAIGHVYRLLRPGGIFVLHVHNRWFNVWDRSGRRWLAAEMGRAVLGRATWDRGAAGGTGFTLHHFTRREAVGMLRDAGFAILEVRPVSLRADGRLPWPWWFRGLRAYGYLVAVRK
jgi:ubiquinone/menaquinone biosynthesis C-methylase UbiE